VILYQNTARGFRSDVDENRIADLLQASFLEKMGRHPAREISAWNNSLRAMEPVLRNSGISDDCGVLVEYKIPLTSRRIDFVVAGEGEDASRNFVVIELKQWQEARSTKKDGIVLTPLGGGLCETTHPSYQAQSYKVLIREYNETVQEKDIRLSSCAYLHNYTESDPEPLKAELYAELVSDSPLYFKHDALRLQEFLRHHVGRGHGMEILYDIQNGRIRPSRKLIDHVCGMYRGNPSFTLIDNQKVAYESAMELARGADEKTVLIVKGGPGTGKSVISVSLIGGLLAERKNVVFVAPNAAFRDVMVTRLAREEKKMILSQLFKGSGSFVDIEENSYDVIVVDESHRLKDGSAYQYRGESQLRDILHAGRCCILFIDDNQRVRPEDIGSVSRIKAEAGEVGARIHEIELEAQFRCAGAEGYINWLDDVLQLKETANYDGWSDGDFDFQIFEDPNELRGAIKSRRSEGYDSRILAGYAWPWTNKGNQDGQVNDVCIEEHGFAMPWNSRASRTTWAIDARGDDQVGCIHTAQGLEFDYVGVLVGEELRFDVARSSFHVDWDAYKDSSGKKSLKEDPEQLSLLVRNIYKVLMSRGMRGCYVFFMDKAVEEHFRRRMPTPSLKSVRLSGSTDSLLVPYENALPLLDLRAVADSGYQALGGLFAEGMEQTWVPVPGGPFPRDRFLVRARGDSMEPVIPDGALCRFRLDPGGSRKGKIVLCLIEGFAGESPLALIKRYYSIRTGARDRDLGEAEEIILQSENEAHDPIHLAPDEQLRILGIFEAVIDDDNARQE
jgi:uncharacterized protein